MAEDKPFNSDEHYPSLDLAYEISMQSYDWSIRRLQDVERRIENLLRLGLTGTAGLAVIARLLTSDQPLGFSDYVTEFSVLAIMCFGFAFLVGLLARRFGHIRLIDPSNLYDVQMRKQKWDAKRDIVYFAGKAHNLNAKLIKRKSDCADMVSMLLGLEAILGIAWLLTI